MSIQPGDYAKNTDATLKELAKQDYTFRVVAIDHIGVAQLEIVGREDYGHLYLFARDLARVDVVQEVS